MRIVNQPNTFLSITNEVTNKPQNEQYIVFAKSGYSKGLCLSNESIIELKNSKKKLGELPLNNEFEIKSFNMIENKTEIDYAIRINPDKKIVYEIITESGKKIKATKEHIFFKHFKGNYKKFDKCEFIETELEKLKVGDRIITK